MFSVPYDYTGQSPLDILKTITLNPILDALTSSPDPVAITTYDPTVNLLANSSGIDITKEAFFQWDPTLPGYLSANSTNRNTLSIKIGQGYWEERAPVLDALTNPLGLLSVGTPVVGSQFLISLHQGWNMIGDPFTVPVSFLKGLQVINNGAPIPFFSVAGDSAVKEGIVSPVLWTWNGTEYVANYVKLDSVGKATNTTKLIPYEGYWLYSYQDTSLLVTNTQQ